jgi:polyisoprenoid-binding protein YceI
VAWQRCPAAFVAHPRKENAMSTTTSHQSTAATTRFTVDPGDTSVEFSVKTFWGLMTVHGRFDSFDGFYEVGPNGTRIELTVDANSLDTGNTTRDKHLRSTDFFHVIEHPHVRFISSRVHEVGGGYLHVVGHLDVAGNVVPLEFPATIRPIGIEHEVEATVAVDQSQLGMSSGQLGMIRRPAMLHIKARLRQ